MKAERALGSVAIARREGPVFEMNFNPQIFGS